MLTADDRLNNGIYFMKKELLFSNRDMSVALNNLVSASLRPASGVIPDARLQKLRDYSSAILAPLMNHVEDELLRPEELISILVSAALFVQLNSIVRTEKLPQARITKILFNKVDDYRAEDRKA